MQQLQLTFTQRNIDIKLIQQHQKTQKKHQFQQRQKLRIKKQTCILKAMKNIPIITSQNKKSIYQSILKMMNYFIPHLILPTPGDLQNHFMEEMLSIFSNFYSKWSQKDPLAKSNRFTNIYCISDLLKLLVQTHRRYFKNILASHQFTQSSQQDPIKYLEGYPTMTSLARRTIQTLNTDEQQQQFKEKSTKIAHKIKHHIHQQWEQYINNSFPTQHNFKTQINQLYLQLLQRNAQNRFQINKFQQKCYGRRNFLFNISTLYSHQQLKKIQHKLKYDINQKYLQIKQLKALPNLYQLKQYFKINIDFQQNLDLLQFKKNNTHKINSLLPILVTKSQSLQVPLNVYVIFNKQYIPIQQFSQKCGLSLKNFMKLIIKDRIEKHQQKAKLFECKSFKKHHFFDLNHSKKKQLMSQLQRTYSKQKKSSIFPFLRTTEQRQQTQIAIKNRSMSDHKPFQRKQTSSNHTSQNHQQFSEQHYNKKLKIHQSQIILKKINVNIKQDCIFNRQSKWIDHHNNRTLSKNQTYNYNANNFIKCIAKKKI